MSFEPVELDTHELRAALAKKILAIGVIPGVATLDDLPNFFRNVEEQTPDFALGCLSFAEEESTSSEGDDSFLSDCVLHMILDGMEEDFAVHHTDPASPEYSKASNLLLDFEIELEKAIPKTLSMVENAMMMAPL